MSRFYARDIRDTILTHLQDSSSGINPMLTTIDTERSTSPSYSPLATKASINRFSTGTYKGQNPELFVTVVNSVREAGGGFQERVTSLVDRYEIDVEIVTKDFAEDLENIMLNYEEALKRTLHAQQRILTGVNYIMYQSMELASIITKNNYFLDTITMKFIVKSF